MQQWNAILRKLISDHRKEALQAFVHSLMRRRALIEEAKLQLNAETHGTQPDKKIVQFKAYWSSISFRTLHAAAG